MSKHTHSRSAWFDAAAFQPAQAGEYETRTKLAPRTVSRRLWNGARWILPWGKPSHFPFRAGDEFRGLAAPHEDRS